METKNLILKCPKMKQQKEYHASVQQQKDFENLWI